MTGFIYDLIYTVPLCLASVLLAGDFIGKEGIAPVICAVLGQITCVVFIHLKTRGRALLFGIVAVPAVAVLIMGEPQAAVAGLWVIRILIICIVCLAVHKAAKDTRIKIAVAAGVFAALIIFMVTGRAVSKTAFICAAFVLVCLISELIQLAWKKEGDTAVRMHVVFMAPFLLAVFIPLMSFHIPDGPFDWKIVKVIITDIRDGIESVAQTFAPWRTWDGGDSMGFSEEAPIGGSLTGYPYKALTVKSSVTDDHRTYLAGKSFDTFSGREWDKNDKSEDDEKSYDLLETVAAIMKRDPEDPGDHMQRIRTQVRYEGVRTKHAFTPPKSSPETSEEMKQKGGDMMLAHGRSADYNVYHYRINRASDLVTEAMKEELPIDRQDFELAAKETSDIIRTEHTYDGYLDYRNNIYDRYLQDTKLSDRAGAYMDELLEGADSDLEKLMRIESLLGRFKYTTTPGDLPENVRTPADFVDYLLFEKKEGYCTYFATAFVLLARAQGIPARYVQGYSTLTKITDYQVLSDRAHAWPEAYIDGFGWVVFEPTPGFWQSAGWDPSENKDKGAKESVPSVYVKSSPEERDDELSQTAGDKDEHRDRDVYRIIILLASIAAFLLIFAVCDVIYRRYRYMRMSDREKILDLCRKNLKTLRFAGIKIGTGETLKEFSQRAANTIPPQHLLFAKVYEEALYAPDRQFENTVTDMEKQRKELISFVICKRVRHLV